ncbi:MAG: aconitate hydratase AcnA, partial [Candidatus Omnitrophica bacterium]|nr:aconitate hydratase AcnA [Candidatus Omnitrophota bacterium]
QMLRAKGVVGKFVEFYGEGLAHLTLPDRATISNMAPEYGATIGLFPVDAETLRYYRLTGRSEEDVELVEKYMKAQGMFYTPGDDNPHYTDELVLDMSQVTPCLAGPKRPQDRIALSDMKDSFTKILTTPVEERGFGLAPEDLKRETMVGNGSKELLTHGSVVIAAITSCTNTSNPYVLIGAGLLAKKAVEHGLKVKNFVKTSFAPGSQVVEEYIRNSGLLPYLEQLGFHIVGYGCTTCIGNSGPLPERISKAIVENDLVAASVLSGNRNFEGRVNPHCKANYLASPPLVVAYALAGSVEKDLTREPIGQGQNGEDVYLKDIWPTQQEISDLVLKFVSAESFVKRYAHVTQGNENWNAISAAASELYAWKENSTYIQEPPFFDGMKKETVPICEIKGARCLVMVGDSVTTDHISPAGAFAAESPAGRYLQENGVQPRDFNSYGSRRGNDRVMTRGTFANIRLRNQL